MSGVETDADSASQDEGHRVKRVKTEEASVSAGQILPRFTSENHVRQNGTHTQSVVPNSGATELDGGEGMPYAPIDIDALAAQAAQAAIADSASPASAITEQTSNSQNYSQQNSDRGKRRRSCLEIPDIDFASAPSDPIELAFWVAQQISHFKDDDTVPSDHENLKQQRLLSYLPSMNRRHSPTETDLVRTAGREKLREDNRERKQRWRRSNMEKSMHVPGHQTITAKYDKISDMFLITDKDNDLRCRINKRAKAIYGTEPSNAKIAWTEAEYNKRRSKRETNQRTRASKGGDFVGFSFTPNLSNTLFSHQAGNHRNDINAAGRLLTDALQVAGSHSTAEPNTHAAEALKNALEDSSKDPTPFVEALQTMATNPEIMSAINAVLDDSNDDDIDTMSGDENGQPSLQSTEIDVRVATHQASIMNHQSNDIIRALNEATALLNEMAETKVYVTPYANPPPKNGGSNGFGAVNGSSTQKSNGTTRSSSKKQVANNHGLDQSQIDALLALANGGSLTDDEDDNTIVDGQDMNGHSGDQEGMPKADNDVTATLQRIINQLMAERNGNRESLYPNGLPITYASQSVRDQAATLQNLFARAGVSINTIIPAAQSHATSQLYLHLSNRARSATPSGGINPAHASAYGNTAQMNHRMLSRPGIFAQLQYNQSHPLQTAASSSRGNVLGPPLRARSAEEVKKIKSYGFPPLPGSRPGGRKQ
ncbi:hypothetical protein MMC24_006818 [Lignoscripta atroalba]|nr:hypothetical protein [Lignoscripta atroalba]